MASDHVASQLEKGLKVSPSTTDSTLVEKSAGTFGVYFYACVTRLFAALHLPKLKSAHRHGRMAPTRVRKLEDFPRGFPKLACFLDSDDAFMVYRRFGSVFSRLLLNKQDEIRTLEAELEAMDKTDRVSGNGNYLMSRTLDIDREHLPDAFNGRSRPKLMEELEKKAMEYAGLLLSARELNALSQPSARDYRSVLHFMENDGGQLFEEESEFIYEKEDLVTIRPGREHAWLDGGIEKLLQMCRCRLLRFFFVSKQIKEKTGDQDIHYYDRGRISTCVTMIITVIILVLLMVPIWLLYKLSVEGTIATSPKTIGVILVPTLMFSAVLSAFTKAKRHELLAASAGYCAVLVVFLGNINNNVGQLP
ncbi:hypothetical protein ABVK25_004092 [Lepraria finkii]|uniref:DUF6594 domain-containing protein n=1 Tax=Lepraria finkii TaxID=1340010 RepID=A0ABR4BEF9_9LECA